MNADETRALIAEARERADRYGDVASGPILRRLADALSAFTVPDGDVREKLRAALLPVTCNVSNYPRLAQAALLGRDLTELNERIEDAILTAFPILSRAAAPEPEWEYGTAHADDPQAVDMGYSLEGAQRRVAQWNASDPERNGIVMRAPRRVWEPLPVGGETDGREV